MATISTNTKKDVYTHAAIILGILIVLFLGFFFVYLPWTTNHGQTIIVPNLEGKTVTEIEDILDERDLRFEVTDSVFIAGKTPLSVHTQYPSPGAKVKEGRKIYITIITETAPMVKLPKLTDLSLKSAELQLLSAGLTKDNLRYIPDIREGVVIDVEYQGKKIEAGTLIAKGSKVVLVLGDGVSNIEIDVPDVIGHTLDEAKLIIKGYKLSVGVTQYDESSTEVAGTVIRQNPAVEDGKIREGQTIDIWIAGPKPVEENQ